MNWLCSDTNHLEEEEVRGGVIVPLRLFKLCFQVGPV